MRILHLSTRLILGGSQENTVLSCEGQARRGHEVHLAFGPIYGPEGSLLARVEAFNEGCRDGRERRGDGGPVTPIGLHVVPHLVREVRPWAEVRCLRELRRLIDGLSPDVVHTHSSKAGILGRAAGWAALRRREREGRGLIDGLPAVRVVHTIHGPPFMPVEGSIVKRLSRRGSNAAYTLAERWAARRCHAIASVADAMTRQFLARGIGHEGLFATVWSGMETRAFLQPTPGQTRDEVRRALGLEDGDQVIGTVARLAEHKGHDDVLSAMGDRLRADPRVKLLWVGDGWWRERLLARAAEMGLRVASVPLAGGEGVARGDGRGASVIVTGLVPPEMVPGCMRAMDVLAHPSAREGLPRTVPQALLCGVCPVAYAADGTGEACIDGVTGRLVAVGDVAGLRSALEWSLDHPAQREALAARGRAMCARRFDAERMVEALERVYALDLVGARAMAAEGGGGVA